MKYHTTFFFTIPLPKLIKKVVNTTAIPVKYQHCPQHAEFLRHELDCLPLGDLIEVSLQLLDPNIAPATEELIVALSETSARAVLSHVVAS